MPQKLSRVILPVIAGGGADGSLRETSGIWPTGRPTDAWPWGESQPGNTIAAAASTSAAEGISRQNGPVGGLEERRRCRRWRQRGLRK